MISSVESKHRTLSASCQLDVGSRDDCQADPHSHLACDELSLSSRSWSLWKRWIRQGPHPSWLLLAELLKTFQRLIRWHIGSAGRQQLFTELFPFQPKVPVLGSSHHNWAASKRRHARSWFRHTACAKPIWVDYGGLNPKQPERATKSGQSSLAKLGMAATSANDSGSAGDVLGRGYFYRQERCEMCGGMQVCDPASELLKAATGSTARYHSQAGPRPDANVMVEMGSPSIAFSHRCPRCRKSPACSVDRDLVTVCPASLRYKGRLYPPRGHDPCRSLRSPQIVMTTLQPHRQLR